MLTKPLSFLSILIKTFSTFIMIILFIMIIYLRIQNILSLGLCIIYLITDIFGYILTLGFAQIIQYLKDLLYLKEKELILKQKEIE